MPVVPAQQLAEDKEAKKPVLNERALKILHSINQQGLIKPQAFSVRGVLKDQPSMVSFGLDKIFYNQLDLGQIPAEEIQETFTSLVYHDKEGMWAISMERDFTSYEGPLDLTLAAMNSLVFIFELKELTQSDNFTATCLQQFNERLYLQGKESKQEYFCEVRQTVTPENKGIPRSALKAVLAPFHLVDALKSIFSDLMVIPVNAIINKLEETPIELFIKGRSAIGQDIAGPNYLRGLEIFHKAFPTVKKMGVHLTRLPLMPLPEFSHQALNANGYNQTWKVLRLKNVKPYQLALLRAKPQDMMVFAENVRDYLVVFRPSLKQRIAAIVELVDPATQLNDGRSLDAPAKNPSGWSHLSPLFFRQGPNLSYLKSGKDNDELKLPTP